MKHSDYITHIKNKEDLPYLKNKLLPVNMRLFETSEGYKDIILQQCNYIRKLALTKMDGYKKMYGLSAANVGLAFNIIGIVRNRNKSNEYCEIMINPIITESSIESIDSLSNCGSITLNNPIAIKRHKKVRIDWYDEKGRFRSLPHTREYNGLTVQHEIDHNNGILITDRV